MSAFSANAFCVSPRDSPSFFSFMAKRSGDISDHIGNSLSTSRPERLPRRHLHRTPRGCIRAEAVRGELGCARERRAPHRLLDVREVEPVALAIHPGHDVADTTPV